MPGNIDNGYFEISRVVNGFAQCFVVHYQDISQCTCDKK